jgi:hypothetical protein
MEIPKLVRILGGMIAIAAVVVLALDIAGGDEFSMRERTARAWAGSAVLMSASHP